MSIRDPKYSIKDCEECNQIRNRVSREYESENEALQESVAILGKALLNQRKEFEDEIKKVGTVLKAEVLKAVDECPTYCKLPYTEADRVISAEMLKSKLERL